MSVATPQLSTPIKLLDASPDFARWVENQLVIGDYLAADQSNGIIGASTLKAFAEFKRDAYLDRPEWVGQSAIDLLAKLTHKDRVSEQPYAPIVQPLAKLDRTGKSATLPIVGLVYEKEEILPGSFLTFGEMFRGFTRMPAASATFGSEDQLVRNAIELAKAFRQVRQKFGSPLRITSAYRPYFLNIGASRSQHRFCRGLDIAPFDGRWKDLLECIKAVDDISGIGIAGESLGFWHMDIRPGSRVIFGYG